MLVRYKYVCKACCCKKAFKLVIDMAEAPSKGTRRLVRLFFAHRRVASMHDEASMWKLQERTTCNGVVFLVLRLAVTAVSAWKWTEADTRNMPCYSTGNMAMHEPICSSGKKEAGTYSMHVLFLRERSHGTSSESTKIRKLLHALLGSGTLKASCLGLHQRWDSSPICLVKPRRLQNTCEWMA